MQATSWQARVFERVDERLARGTLAGLAAGLLFLVANMGWATYKDMPAVAPLLDISTVFNVADKPVPSPENMVIGLVTHLTLTVLFGIGFALLVPLVRERRMLAAAGVAYGVALYLVNFQILGRTAFPWFQEGPDQVFELVVHAAYGLVLVPYFVGLVPGAAAQASTAQPARRVAAAAK